MRGHQPEDRQTLQIQPLDAYLQRTLRESTPRRGSAPELFGWAVPGPLQGLATTLPAVPELPEVETIRRFLAPVLEGSRVVRVELRHPRLARRQPRPSDIPERLEGRRVHELGRRGKYLLASVEADLTWVVHLGMSGRMMLAEPGDPETPHTHMVVWTDRGHQVRMIDPRTFGFVAVYTPEELAASRVARLGPDALTDLPRSPVIARAMRGRAVAVKTLLLDQALLAGLGNIYTDEVLHRARVRPDRRAGTLSGEEVRLIRAAIRPVLEGGLRWGGTSLGDLSYLLPDGRAGAFAARLRVHGREGQPCLRCGTLIERHVVGQRSSYWCAGCQR